MTRIVSLLPSATEIAFALGLGDRVVGVTFECDTPAEARVGRSIVVGGLDTHGRTPGEIDALVREQVAAGEDLYRLDADAFAACRPDVVLTQDLCRVCALPSGEASDALAHLGCEAEVVTLDPHRLDDVLGTVEVVARACGVPEAGASLAASLRDRLDVVRDAVAGRPRPRVLVLEWTDPPFLAGHWVPDLVDAAGGEAVLAAPGARSVSTTWDEVAAAAVDLVLVAPCGFRLDDAVQQATAVLGRLPAEVPVWAIDADGCVVRPGPRLVDGVEAIATVLHADAALRPHAVDRVVRRVR